MLAGRWAHRSISPRSRRVTVSGTGAGGASRRAAHALRYSSVVGSQLGLEVPRFDR